MAMYMSICLFFCLVVIRYNKVTAVSAVQESIIQLKCPYTATAYKTIDWNKQINGRTTRYTIGTVINPKLPSELRSRLTVTGDHTAGDYHLSISDVRKSDEGNYECAIFGTSSVISYRLQLTVISIPEIPGNFSMITASTTSITIVWDPKSGGGHVQAFYILFRVQGSLSWTAVSAGEEGINEQKRRRTYELKNLQEGQAYELRMFSENTAGKRSYYTEVLLTFTKSSESLTSLSTIIGGVVGAIVTLGIVCASVMGIVFFKRRKGQDQTEKNDKSHENTGFQENQRENEYEEVGNKCDVQKKQSSKTYESLGIKDTLNVYDDLENPKGLIPSKSSLGLYEALGNQDNPSMYTALQNQKEQTQLRKQQVETNIRNASNNPKKNLELYTNQRPSQNVYDNEGF